MTDRKGQFELKGLIPNTTVILHAVHIPSEVFSSGDWFSFSLQEIANEMPKTWVSEDKIEFNLAPGEVKTGVKVILTLP